MAYIFDTRRKSLGTLAIPLGADDTVTVLSEFKVTPDAAETFLDIRENGEIFIGDDGGINNITLNGGIRYNFKQIIGVALNYDLEEDDYAIEIVSDTYNSVTLPFATGRGGRAFLISRGSDNNAFVIKTQIGDTLDTRTQVPIKRKNEHIRVMSFDNNKWFTI